MRRSWVRGVAWLGAAGFATLAAVTTLSRAPRVRTEDRNGDGRPDVWRFFDANDRPTDVRIDTDFDGRSDVQEHYNHGALVRRESDRNFDDRIDLVEEFDPATREQLRTVIDEDYDGLADRLILFADGRPVFSKSLRSVGQAMGSPERRASAALEDPRHDDDTLAALVDPFREDMSLRGSMRTRSSSDTPFLSASMGLPDGYIQTHRPVPPTARIFACDAHRLASVSPSGQFPRGPPLF